MTTPWKVLCCAAALAVPVIACGSGESDSASGTTADGSETEEDCDNGATRTCVGPGACEGGQICERGEWSGCDCGDGVVLEGSSGEGGAGSAPTAEPSAVVSRGGAAGARSDDGTSGLGGGTDQSVGGSDDGNGDSGAAAGGTTTDESSGGAPGVKLPQPPETLIEIPLEANEEGIVEASSNPLGIEMQWAFYAPYSCLEDRVPPGMDSGGPLLPGQDGDACLYGTWFACSAEVSISLRTTNRWLDIVEDDLFGFAFDLTWEAPPNGSGDFEPYASIGGEEDPRVRYSLPVDEGTTPITWTFADPATQFTDPENPPMVIGGLVIRIPPQELGRPLGLCVSNVRALVGSDP